MEDVKIAFQNSIYVVTVINLFVMNVVMYVVIVENFYAIDVMYIVTNVPIPFVMIVLVEMNTQDFVRIVHDKIYLLEMLQEFSWDISIMSDLLIYILFVFFCAQKI